MGDAVLAADPIKHRLPAAAESGGELFAVIAQKFFGDAVTAHRGDQGQTHRSTGRAGHHRGDHAVAGVVIDAGDDLGFGAVDGDDPVDDVHLPQFHRSLPLPADVVAAAAFTPDRGDQPMPDQDLIDRRQRRDRTRTPVAAEFVLQPTLAPLRMIAPQLANRRLDLGRSVGRMGMRPMRPIRQSVQTFVPVPGQPTVHRLPRHANLLGDFHHGHPGPDL
jgi:hypothetical protein